MNPKYLEIPFGGKSMHPFFKEGDILIIDEHSTKSSLKTGECIVFLDNTNQITAHRVIQSNPLILKGDRSICFDQEPKKVIGKVQVFQFVFIQKIICILSKQNLTENKRRGIILLPLIFLLFFSRVIHRGYAFLNR